MMIVVLCFYLILQTYAFYLPGVNPQDYEEGAQVELFVNKLESSQTQLPFNYYFLGFCKPEKIKEQTENIGQVLMGSRMENSPIELFMNKNESCKTLCLKQFKSKQIKNFQWFIDHDYRVNWVVDNLPSAWRQTFYNNELGARIAHYDTGFPIGWTEKRANSPKLKQYFIYNHFKIIIKIFKTHQHDENDQNDPPTSYRIVGFQVEPYSLKHSLQGETFVGGCKSDAYIDEQKILDILPENPAYSSVGDFNYATNSKYPSEMLGQHVMFTYGIRFIESQIQWGSRWDLYLYLEKDQDKIHWFSIINSLLVVLFLTGIVAHILQRTIRKDVEQYQQISEQDKEIEQETGWKQVHGDVFRTPKYFSLLSSLVGTGVQVIAMTIIVQFFALLGFLSPSYRGGLLTTMLLNFVFMSIFAGYYSTKLYKTFQGQWWKKNIFITSLMFPGVCFLIFFTLNFLLVIERSSGAVPFGTLVTILTLWFGISMPLTFLGGAIGVKSEDFKMPCKINKVPKPIRQQKWYLNSKLIVLIGGILPFGAIFIELMFIMKSMWTVSTFYYMFGFLFLVLIILLITSSEISIVSIYFQLCAEDYRWWWRSYFVSGASGFYLFCYSLFYLITQLEMTRFSSIMLYLGYMFLASYAMFIFTGTTGFLATFWFVRKIYSLIKVD